MLNLNSVKIRETEALWVNGATIEKEGFDDDSQEICPLEIRMFLAPHYVGDPDGEEILLDDGLPIICWSIFYQYKVKGAAWDDDKLAGDWECEQEYEDFGTNRHEILKFYNLI